jgi:glycosyltransferase involved in cell wall biosynthesis
MVVGPRSVGSMPHVLAAAHACLVLLRDLPAFRGVLPAKMFEAMAMGKPIVLSAPRGEASRLVEEFGCGIWVPPEDGAALASALRELATSPNAVEEMGAAGRRLAERAFSRDRMTEEVRSCLEGIARSAGA